MHRLRSVLRSRRVISVSPTANVYDAAVTMTQGRVGAIPVLDGERLVGIFSERDLMTRVVVRGLDARTTAVSEVMTSEVTIASLEEHVNDCLEKMRRVGCRHLPVIEEGHVVGVLSMRDLLRDEIEEQDHEIRDLRAYLHQTPV